MLIRLPVLDTILRRPAWFDYQLPLPADKRSFQNILNVYNSVEGSGKIQKEKVREAMRHLRVYGEFCADDVSSVQSHSLVSSFVSQSVSQFSTTRSSPTAVTYVYILAV
jgi:hypothetical protein